MKTFLRILIFTTSTLSFLLSIASLSIWIRSRHVQDYIEIRDAFILPAADGKVDPHSRRMVIDSTWGRVRFSSHDQSYGLATTQQAKVFRIQHVVNHARMPPHTEPQKGIRTGPEGKLNRLGFYYWTGQQPGRPGIRMRVIGLPYFAPALLFAILPLSRLTLFLIRRKKKKLNLCPTCGYDLRASPDRCSECGVPTPTQPVSSCS